jgi:N-acetyl-anhydromuramyl-L-alanine amidase AmpD
MVSEADYSGAVWSPSPNYWSSRQGFDIQYIVLHGTGGLMPGCLNWLDSIQSGASVHYLVDRQGHTYQLVREQFAAWGNGIPEPGSKFYGGNNPNLFTLSIETERDEYNTSPVTDQQRNALVALCRDIRQRHGPLPIIPHSAISPQSRAHCPGQAYPLQRIDQESQHTGPSEITWVRFSGTPQKTPIVFYKDASFSIPLYPSSATRTSVLSFDAWRYGTSVNDVSTGQADRRWFKRYNPHGNEGWVPSAWILGSPPNSQP